jgi:hypothetical protein
MLLLLLLLLLPGRICTWTSYRARIGTRAREAPCPPQRWMSFRAPPLAAARGNLSTSGVSARSAVVRRAPGAPPAALAYVVYWRSTGTPRL